MEPLLVAGHVAKAAWQKLVEQWRTPIGRRLIELCAVAVLVFLAYEKGKHSVPTVSSKTDTTSKTQTNSNTAATTNTVAKQDTNTATTKDIDETVHQDEVKTVIVQPNGAKRIVIRRVTDTDLHVEEAQQVNVSIDFSQLRIETAAVSTLATTQTQTTTVQSTNDAPLATSVNVLGGVNLDGVSPVVGIQVEHQLGKLPLFNLPVKGSAFGLTGSHDKIVGVSAGVSF